MYDLNLFSCVYVCWLVLLADGVWLACFACKCRCFCLKRGLHSRVLERSCCRIVVRTVCSSLGCDVD